MFNVQEIQDRGAALGLTPLAAYSRNDDATVFPFTRGDVRRINNDKTEMLVGFLVLVKGDGENVIERRFKNLCKMYDTARKSYV